MHMHAETTHTSLQTVNTKIRFKVKIFFKWWKIGKLLIVLLNDRSVPNLCYTQEWRFLGLIMHQKRLEAQLSWIIWESFERMPTTLLTRWRHWLQVKMSTLDWSLMLTLQHCDILPRFNRHYNTELHWFNNCEQNLLNKTADKHRIIWLKVDVKFHIGVGWYTKSFTSFSTVGIFSLDPEQGSFTRLHRPQSLLHTFHYVDFRAFSESELGVAIQKHAAVVSANQPHCNSAGQVTHRQYLPLKIKSLKGWKKYRKKLLHSVNLHSSWWIQMQATQWCGKVLQYVGHRTSDPEVAHLVPAVLLPCSDPRQVVQTRSSVH